MPQAYCNECDATVTVRDGRCLLGHPVDIVDVRKRRRRRGRHTAPRSKARPVADSPPRPAASPPAPTPPPLRPETPDPSPPGRTGDTLDPTRDLVAVLWEQEPTPRIDEWASSEPPPPVLPSRRHRWTTLVIPLVAVVAAVALWWYVDDSAARTQSQARAAVAEAADELSAVAERLSVDLAQLPDVVADPRRRAALVTGTAGLDAAARRLFDAAAALPADLDDPDRVRLRASELARRSFAAATDITETFAVAAALTPLEERPDLPPSVPPEAVPDLAAEVAWWITRVDGTAPDLPTTPRWRRLGDALGGLSARLDTFQEDYLGAVRDGDPERAAAVVASLDQATLEVVAVLDAVLADVGVETSVELAEIARLSGDLAQGPR